MKATGNWAFRGVVQNVERGLSDVAALLLDGDRTARADIVLSKLSFKNLTDVTDVMLARFIDERRFSDAEDRKAKFRTICERCRKISGRRNALIHSTYAHLHGNEAYKGLLRSKLRLRTGGTSGGARHEDEEEVLTSDDFEQAIQECQSLVGDLNGFRLWLIENTEPWTP